MRQRRQLTPVTLELGGKSPVIVSDSYDLAEAAQRVMAVSAQRGQIWPSDAGLCPGACGKRA